MKYNELHRLLKKHGCYPTGGEIAGHPEWYSPLTQETNEDAEQHPENGGAEIVPAVAAIRIYYIYTSKSYYHEKSCYLH